MTTCFIDIVNMFFNMFLKHVLKTRKRFKNQSPIKLLFKTFLKHHLDILKTFLKCQIVSWNTGLQEDGHMAQERVHPFFILKPAQSDRRHRRPSSPTPVGPETILRKGTLPSPADPVCSIEPYNSKSHSVKQKILTDMVQELVKDECVQELHTGEYGFFSRVFCFPSNRACGAW